MSSHTIYMFENLALGEYTTEKLCTCQSGLLRHQLYLSHTQKGKAGRHSRLKNTEKQSCGNSPSEIGDGRVKHQD